MKDKASTNKKIGRRSRKPKAKAEDETKKPPFEITLDEFGRVQNPHIDEMIACLNEKQKSNES